MIIAIDGPAASGKSTTAKKIAELLDLMYLDTGAMYRATALYLKRKNVDINDFIALETSIEKIQIQFKKTAQNKEYQIILNNDDISEEIRTPQITKLSSEIATIGIVRKKMVEIQREMAQNHNVILDGRDIGTIVFPNADFKFYITASLETRANRRYKELKAKGVDIEIEQIKQDLIWRDQNDQNRDIAPLKKADDAIEINTTNMTIKEQTNFIIKHIRKSLA